MNMDNNDKAVVDLKCPTIRIGDMRRLITKPYRAT